jgi:hypothetical protein
VAVLGGSHDLTDALNRQGAAGLEYLRVSVQAYKEWQGEAGRAMLENLRRCVGPEYVGHITWLLRSIRPMRATPKAKLPSACPTSERNDYRLVRACRCVRSRLPQLPYARRWGGPRRVGDLALCA